MNKIFNNLLTETKVMDKAQFMLFGHNRLHYMWISFNCVWVGEPISNDWFTNPLHIRMPILYIQYSYNVQDHHIKYTISFRFMYHV